MCRAGGSEAALDLEDETEQGVFHHERKRLLRPFRLPAPDECWRPGPGRSCGGELDQPHRCDPEARVPAFRSTPNTLMLSVHVVLPILAGSGSRASDREENRGRQPEGGVGWSLT